jgi:hypothetical protein
VRLEPGATSNFIADTKLIVVPQAVDTVGSLGEEHCLPLWSF